MNISYGKVDCPKNSIVRQDPECPILRGTILNIVKGKWPKCRILRRTILSILS